jgi:hypothetical protein
MVGCPRPAHKEFAMFRILLAFALLTLPAPKVPGRLHRMHDTIKQEHDFDRDRSRGYDQVNFTAHGITEIALERTEPAGDGVEYATFLYADGTIRFAGVRHPERVGMYVGKTTRWQFDALAQYIVALGYMDLEHTFTGSDFDRSTVFTGVVRDDVRYVVRNDSRAGPPALWAMEQVIEKLLEDATWERTGDLEDKSR